jgi:hypothetical protein
VPEDQIGFDKPSKPQGDLRLDTPARNTTLHHALKLPTAGHAVHRRPLQHQRQRRISTLDAPSSPRRR